MQFLVRICACHLIGSCILAVTDINQQYKYEEMHMISSAKKGRLIVIVSFNSHFAS